MKKILVTILTLISLLSLPQVAFANDDEFVGPPEETTPIINDTTTLDEATFDVGILSLDGEKQKNGFFSGSDNQPPIVRVLLSVISFFANVMGSIAVLLFIIAGFMLIFAQGNQQNIDSAKDTVKYAIIGMVITFLSYTIIIAIQSIFNAA